MKHEKAGRLVLSRLDLEDAVAAELVTCLGASVADIAATQRAMITVISLVKLLAHL